MMEVPVGKNHCRFDEEPLEKALKDIIRETAGDENAPMADNDKNPHFCPTFVVATEGQDASGREKLFKSYGFYKDRCPIWQAARATSAAPSYFTPAWVEVPAPGGWYIDGGLKHNNPSEVALAEAKRYWRAVRRVLIVSIGTGVQKSVNFIINPDPPEKLGSKRSSTSMDCQPPPDSKRRRISSLGRISAAVGSLISSVAGGVKAAASRVPFAEDAVQLSRMPGGLDTLKQFAKELVKLSAESEDTSRRMWDLAKSADTNLPFPYYRFNVASGMDDIGLEEWRENIKMGALTRGYLGTPSVAHEIEECAEILLNPSPFESM
jgi:predicted acylesterase/phospholipase RssA